MGDRSLYDEDILVWSEQQAAALRSLASRRDLPNELDLANVIEEIEDVGRSDFHAVDSHVRIILGSSGACLGAILVPGIAPLGCGSRHWRVELLRAHHTQSMRGRLDMDSLWRRALRSSRIWPGGIGAGRRLVNAPAGSAP